jgi:hypothetical protein
MTQENRDKIKVLPNIDYLKQQSPLDEKGKHLIESSREQVREIFA